MTKAKTPTQNQPHHYVRTIFAGLFGTIALVLVLASILIVWANRTLTDTSTYTKTVAPLVERPEVKEFVATRVTEQLQESAPPRELAEALLSPEQRVGKTPEQLATAAAGVVRASVSQILDSPAFAELWRQTNEANHAKFVGQLEADSSEVTLDLGPFVSGVMQELKQTKLAPLSQQIELAPEKTKLSLKGSQVEKIHTFYELLKTAAPIVVLVTLLALGLCIWISVHHTKTLRRMLAGTGAIALGVAAAIQIPSLVTLPGDNAEVRELATALVGTLLQPLQLVCLIITGLCVAVIAVSMWYERRRRTA